MSYHENCTCEECAESEGHISPVEGECTEVYLASDDNEDEGVYQGDLVEDSYEGGFDTAYQCDECDEVHSYHSDALECCVKWECNFCGYVHSGNSYWNSAKANAAECCVTSCDECGETGFPDWISDHECDNGKGMRRQLPWEARGVQVDARDPEENTDWKSAWGLDPEEHNVVQAAADYYVLEAIKSGLVGTTSPGVECLAVDREVSEHTLMRIIRTEADEMFSALVDKWDPILISYTHMAVGGELRHHNAVGGEVLDDNRDRAWNGWKLIFEAVGPDALTDAADLFKEFSGGSFGGTPWADACIILHRRLTGKIDRALFLDRIFNAQHNGGCLLNKVTWAGDMAKRGRSNGHKAMTVDELTYQVLPAHGLSPEPNYSLLLAYASPEVNALFADAHEYGRRARLDMGKTLANLTARPSKGLTKREEQEDATKKAQAKMIAQSKLPKSAKLEQEIKQVQHYIKTYAEYITHGEAEAVKAKAQFEATGEHPCCAACTYAGQDTYYVAVKAEYEAKLTKLIYKWEEALTAEALNTPAVSYIDTELEALLAEEQATYDAQNPVHDDF